MEHTQVIHDIQKSLLAMQDLSYRDFQVKLMPTVDKETVIGVRTPQLRSFAKAFGKTAEAGEFLAQLPAHLLRREQPARHAAGADTRLSGSDH